MMKTRTSSSQQVKGSGTGGMNSTRVVFELKRKVVVALNKLADRDTYQLGIRELESIVESLNPEGVLPFLSCIVDMDSDQKSMVRKECVRLMGYLARLYPHRVVPHLGKIVSSIVKRFKDTDSVVRDACVETIGILSLELGSCKDGGDGVFVSLMKPFFEALGEQNKQLQSGSALCLSKVIDCTQDPPLVILQQMLSRTIKLLKNPHFVAKPAVIQLNTSIIKAGGAPSQTILSAAIHSIQEALKNSDWNTRKAASVALGDIASSEDPLLEFHRASCIHGLESCRFDKVKPVREAVLQALKAWQCHQISSTPGYSPQASSLSRGEYLCEDGDAIDVKRTRGDFSKAKFSPSERTPGPVFSDKPQCVKKSSWQLDMGNSKSPRPSPLISEILSEKSVKRSISNIRMGTNTMKFGVKGMAAGDQRTQYAQNDYAPQTEKHQFVSTLTGVDGYCKSKFAPELSSACIENAIEISAESSPQSAIEDVSSVNQSCLTKSQDRNSFDSNLTDSRSQVTGCCCIQTANTLSSMKKQLSEIENKQSTIVDLLQALANSTTNSLTLTQSKVTDLGAAIDNIADSLLREGRYSDQAISRFSRGLNSSSDSSYLPSPADGRISKLPSKSFKHSKLWEQNEFTDSSTADRNMWTNYPGYISNYLNTSDKKFPQRKSSIDNETNGEFDSYSDTLVRHSAKECRTEDNDVIWTRVMSFVTEGDLESAYAEALCSEDELLLVELLDQSTPVLDRLTRNTANELLSALASHLHHGKNIHIIIPWIRQIVNLSSTHGLNYHLGLPLNLKNELLMAISEAAKMQSPLQKRMLSQLHARLHLLWGGKA